MPQIIDIDDNGNLAESVVAAGVVKSRSKRPEFNPQNTFHSELNGAGGATSSRSGLINASAHPANPDLTYAPSTDKLVGNQRVTQGETTLRYLPTGPVSSGNYARMRSVASSVYREKLVDIDAALDLEDIVFSTGAHKIYLDVAPQTMITRKTVTQVSGSTDTVRTLHTEYVVRIIVLRDTDDPTDDQKQAIAPVIFDQYPRQNTGDIFTYLGVTYDVMADLEDMLLSVQSMVPGTNLKLLDSNEVKEYFTDEYSLYTRLCNQAKYFRTNEVAENLSIIINDALGESPMVGVDQHMMLNVISYELQRLHKYEVPLETYNLLYDTIMALPNEDHRDVLIRQNMQLSLNRNLYDLADIKDQLATPPHAPVNYTVDSKYSTQQVNAITTSDPLIIAQAGAGTGKSTVINERMKFLTASGVDPKSITVLSFTNAAADHIKALNPDVNSMTTARMIHEVYTHNYPSHMISTIDTILNSIPIYYRDQAQSSQFLVVFSRLLREATIKSSNATMTALSAFIERYTDEVIQVLDVLGQTSLEIEIIISYLKINDPNFVEPFTSSPDYLIIDEVQDNSSFEFVYSLKYAAKHQCSMYLVGDSSQTLYEFRAANPKALNALESSGVFGTYRLTTNYRSNQEILDFANVHLLDIEANKFAKIQLQANSLDMPTLESFTEKVQLITVDDTTKIKFKEDMVAAFDNPITEGFIEENIAKQEPTAVLCATNAEVKNVMATLERKYPHAEVTSLVSERAYTKTIFSKFIGRYWDEITSVDPSHASFIFGRQLKAHASALDRFYGENAGALDQLIAAWWTSASSTVGQLLATYQLKVGDPDALDAFFQGFQDTILNYEIENNSIAQRLTDARNRARKEARTKSNPMLMVSTIHGVKGLEFPHTIVLKAPDSAKTDESTKRMYYVALTRARESELIIAGVSKRAKSRIVTDHENMITVLEKRDADNDLKDTQNAAQDMIDTAGQTDSTVGTAPTEDAGDTENVVTSDVNGDSDSPE